MTAVTTTTLDETLDRAEAACDDLMRATGDRWTVTFHSGLKSKDYGWFVYRNDAQVYHAPAWADLDTVLDWAYAQYATDTNN